jgi:signal peptidase I
MIHTKNKPGFFSSYKGLIEFVGLLLLVFLIRTFGFGLYQVPSGSMETTMLVGERFFADKFTYLLSKPKRGNIIAFNDVLYKYSTNPFKFWFEQYVYGPSNVTKRVIGLPGERIRGTVENGRPVIYVNDVKLDEPYLNKYPLIIVYKEDKNVLLKRIDNELSSIFRGRALDPKTIDILRQKELAHYTGLQSYDPSAPDDKQPFYQVKPNRVVQGAQGERELWYPGTPCRPMHERKGYDKSYWDGSDEFYVELGPDQYWVMGDNRLGSKDSRSFGPIKASFIHGKIVFRIWSVESDESWWILDLIKHPINFWQRVRWNRFFQMLT